MRNGKAQKGAVEAMLTKLYFAAIPYLCDVNAEVYVTPEPVPFSERTTGERKEIHKGDTWGNLWDCGWFHLTGTVPESAKGKKVILFVDVHGEMCLYDNDGKPVQGLTSGSVYKTFYPFGARKQEIPVCDCAEGGEVIDLWLDAGCNYIDHQLPSVGTVEFMDMRIRHEYLKDLFYDLFVLYDLMTNLPEEDERCDTLLTALFDATCEIYEFTEEEVAKARAILKKELDKKGENVNLSMTTIGHSHIDLAWLWPIRETKRKVVRTLCNALRAFEKYPDYIFGISQPQIFSWLKEEQPALYEELKTRVEDGHLELQGGMWVEADNNVPSGESLVRQFLYGKRFFRQEFGKEMKMLWLPDVFGYNMALPQIMKKCGVEYFLTIKLQNMSQHNLFPYNTFNWKGIDGTEVLAHMPPERNYNSMGMPWSLIRAEKNRVDTESPGEALLLVGVGDGGGGAGELMLESMQRDRNLQGIPTHKPGHAQDFFERIAKKREKFPVYEGELYLEKHQGTYTTMGQNKWYNRRMERLLREVEFASVVTGSPYPQKRLEEIWKEVLLYQFHDLLPGSSIKRVYDESLARYAVLYDEVNTMIDEMYTEGCYAINSLSWDRQGWEKIDGKWYNLSVPAMGSTLLTDGIESKEVAVEDCGVLENDCVQVFFDTDGAVLSIYDKKEERESLREKSNCLSVYYDDGDAWDMNELYRMRKPKQFRLVSAEAFTDGPMHGIRQEYVYGKSRLWQTVSIVDGSPIVTFDTKVDWQERERMLRTAFYTDIDTDKVSCDIQYGTIKRNTHIKDSWDMAKFEICAHKYVDLSNDTYGVALMNDCKYGHCVKENMLDIDLLRSSSYPNEEADRGEHHITYALYPHTGTLEESDVLKKSYELNQKLWVGGKVEQLFTLSNPDIVVESVKKAEDSDAIIIRMYETKGGCAETAINFTKPVTSAYLVDMMEENEKEIDLNSIPFHGFEIVTVKVNL
ncbi:MAG: alpha-mannosidase [Clostridia bacterium]|nr:alpha-mannosidase [Clostridia bacterium]